MVLTLLHDQPAGRSQRHFDRFTSERVLERLHALDDKAREEGLEALNPSDEPLIPIGMEIGSSGRVIKNSYGVFNLSWQAQSHPQWPDQIAAEVDHIRRRIKEAHGVPLRYLIWAGMGGSVEDKSMYQSVGLFRGGPRFYTLDSTDPAKLKYIVEDIQSRARTGLAAALRSTLVVGMAMGMTSYEPVINLDKLSALYQRHGIDSRPNFAYLTLPDSLLDRFARAQGYQKIELQLDGANTTAGRHSGPLTRGSLYPLALAGADLRSWIDSTILSSQDIHLAWKLSSFIHAQSESGRDKVTLLLPGVWAGAGLWTKQDFEESLGKREDTGLKIIIGEKPKLANYRAPKDMRQDRLFLAVRVQGMPDPEGQKVASLRRAGYPVAVLTLPRGATLSLYMQFIHYVVFGLGYLCEMNFVTQPGVELYKTIAHEVHAEAKAAGGVEHSTAWRSMVQSPHQAAWRGVLTLYYDQLATEGTARPGDAAQVYAHILKRITATRNVDYAELTWFGDMRYSPQGRQVRKTLDRAAERLFRSQLKMPVDVYEGPAMNHSYHEMIIGCGRCFSSVLLSRQQESFAAADYRPDYHVAQFLATKLALERRNRAVVAILMKDSGEKAVAALNDFFKQVTALIKA